MEGYGTIGSEENVEEKSSYRSLFKDKQLRVVFLLFSFTTFVANFAISLLSIYYIIILEISDDIAGILLALYALQAVFCFIPAYLEKIYHMKQIYLMSFVGSILALVLIIFVENLPFQIVVLTLLFCYLPGVLYTCFLAEIQKRSTLSNRSLGFSLANSLFNLTTIFLALSYELVVFLNDLNTLTFQIIFSILIILLLLSLLITIFLYEDFSPTKPKETYNMSNILNLKRFWKTIAVMLITAFPMSIYLSPGTILPIYMDRELGTTSGYGILYSLFFLFTGILSLLFNFTINFLSQYDNLIIGTLIIAISPVSLIISDSYLSICIYLLILSIGSSIVCSRSMDYVGAVSIKGLEIYFYGLMQISYSFSILIIGLVTGFTLEAFCPEDGERKSWAMWVVLSAISFIGGLILIIFKPWIQVVFDNEETDPYMVSGHLS